MKWVKMKVDASEYMEKLCHSNSVLGCKSSVHYQLSCGLDPRHKLETHEPNLLQDENLRRLNG